MYIELSSLLELPGNKKASVKFLLFLGTHSVVHVLHL